MSQQTDTAPDTEAAIAAYLIDEIGDMVSGRVYRPALPDRKSQQAARPCIVVRPAGGYVKYGSSDLRLADPRVDVICYGSTRLESQNVARAVILALKRLRRRVYESTLLHSVNVSGLVPMTDPDTGWATAVVSAQVIQAELALG